MDENKKSHFKVVAEPLSDDALEDEAGGFFGQTPHTVYLNSKNYNMWIATYPDQVALFGASWCGPCHSVTDTLELLAAENPNYQVAIVDVDENPQWWGNYITAIPTVIKFHDGFEIQRITGTQSLETFRKLF